MKQRFVYNFSDDHWLHHPMKVKKSKFTFIFTLYFRSFMCINCYDSVLIVQNTRRRKVIKQRVRP